MNTAENELHYKGEPNGPLFVPGSLSLVRMANTAENQIFNKLSDVEENEMSLVLTLKRSSSSCAQELDRDLSLVRLENEFEIELFRRVENELRSINFETEGFECDPANSTNRDKITRVKRLIELDNGVECKILFFKAKEKKLLMEKLSFSGSLGYLLGSEYNIYVCEIKTGKDYVIIQASIGSDILKLPTMIAF